MNPTSPTMCTASRVQSKTRNQTKIMTFKKGFNLQRMENGNFIRSSGIPEWLPRFWIQGT